MDYRAHLRKTLQYPKCPSLQTTLPFLSTDPSRLAVVPYFSLRKLYLGPGATIDDLPLEILAQIASLCDSRTIISLSTCSRIVRTGCYSALAIRQLLVRTLGVTVGKIIRNLAWSDDDPQDLLDDYDGLDLLEQLQRVAGRDPAIWIRFAVAEDRAISLLELVKDPSVVLPLRFADALAHLLVAGHPILYHPMWLTNMDLFKRAFNCDEWTSARFCLLALHLHFQEILPCRLYSWLLGHPSPSTLRLPFHTLLYSYFGCRDDAFLKALIVLVRAIFNSAELFPADVSAMPPHFSKIQRDLCLQIRRTPEERASQALSRTDTSLITEDDAHIALPPVIPSNTLFNRFFSPWTNWYVERCSALLNPEILCTGEWTGYTAAVDTCEPDSTRPSSPPRVVKIRFQEIDKDSFEALARAQMSSLVSKQDTADSDKDGADGKVHEELDDQDKYEHQSDGDGKEEPSTSGVHSNSDRNTMEDLGDEEIAKGPSSSIEDDTDSEEQSDSEDDSAAWPTWRRHVDTSRPPPFPPSYPEAQRVLFFRATTTTSASGPFDLLCSAAISPVSNVADAYKNVRLHACERAQDSGEVRFWDCQVTPCGVHGFYGQRLEESLGLTRIQEGFVGGYVWIWKDASA